MNKTILLLYVIFIFLTASFVIAPSAGGTSSAGGGISGDSETSSGSSSRSDTYFGDLKCYDTGQLTFQQKPVIKPVIVEKEDGTKLTISGEWEGTTFKSEEAEVNSPGIYTISDSKNGNKTIGCPGLKFSCKLVELDLQSCSYENNQIIATFTLFGKGASVDDLQFQFQKDNSSQFLLYNKGSFSSELKNPQISEKNNGYILTVANVPGISGLKVSYPKCVGKYYVQKRIDCLKSSQQEEINNYKEEIYEKKAGELQEKQERLIISRIISFFRRFFSKNI